MARRRTIGSTDRLPQLSFVRSRAVDEVPKPHGAGGLSPDTSEGANIAWLAIARESDGKERAALVGTRREKH